MGEAKQKIQEQQATLVNLQKRMFNQELHFTLVTVKLNEVLEYLCVTGDENAEAIHGRHIKELAGAMESYLSHAKDYGSQINDALEKLAQAGTDEEG